MDCILLRFAEFGEASIFEMPGVAVVRRNMIYALLRIVSLSKTGNFPEEHNMKDRRVSNSLRTSHCVSLRAFQCLGRDAVGGALFMSGVSKREVANEDCKYDRVA